MSEYLEKHGLALIEAGYNIVPIALGEKAPRFGGWQNTKADKQQYRAWLSEGRGRHGVGVLTKNTPAVDIDIMDEDIADVVEGWFTEAMGAAPTRVGQAPKRLLVYKGTTPFPKLRSSVWFDEWDEKQQIEILCDGQQFVAYHTHPDTRLPYTWTTESEPLNTHVDELPAFDVEKARELLTRFDELALECGWTLLKKARKPLMGGQIDPDDPFIEDSQPVDLTPEELRARLMLLGVDYAEDYDFWINVGMALYHQYDGNGDGLELWHEWAEQASNYAGEALDQKWDGFLIEGKGRSPITARYILKLAIEASDLQAQAAVVEMREAFKKATDEAAWREACSRAKKAEVDGVTRAALAELGKDSYQRITGLKISKQDALKAIRYELNAKNVPGWCKPWVYDTETDRFVSTKSRMAVSRQGFNAINDRYAMAKGDILDGGGKPRMASSELALQIYQIPAVTGQRYAPGMDVVYNEHGIPYVNTYSTIGIPKTPDTLSPRDQRNIAIVEGHIAHLLEDPREQSLFLDFLAHTAAKPGKRINWAILLQGVEGDGKSFWATLMRAVMGFSNVRVVNGSMLEERFTDWAEGQCLVCIEEIRMIGHNRYDVSNRVKPFITNDVIEIHPKGWKSREVHNTSNYMMFTNYRDALPLDDNSRRYCVLFSRWQRKSDLEVFVRENPNYYVNLYRAIEQSAGALRQWLLRHEPSEHFMPRGNAPVTEATRKMAEKSKPLFIEYLEELVADGEHADINHEAVNVTKAAEIFRLDNGRDDMPAARRLATMLEGAGYATLGRHRIHRGEEKMRFYSRSINPEMAAKKVKEAIDSAIKTASKKAKEAPTEDVFADL